MLLLQRQRHFSNLQLWEQHLAAIFAAGSRSHLAKIFLRDNVSMQHYESTLMIRKATIKDVKALHVLLQEYGKKEELLARPLSKLYDHLRDFCDYWTIRITI